MCDPLGDPSTDGYIKVYSPKPSAGASSSGDGDAASADGDAGGSPSRVTRRRRVD